MLLWASLDSKALQGEAAWFGSSRESLGSELTLELPPFGTERAVCFSLLLKAHSQKPLNIHAPLRISLLSLPRTPHTLAACWEPMKQGFPRTQLPSAANTSSFNYRLPAAKQLFHQPQWLLFFIRTEHRKTCTKRTSSILNTTPPHFYSQTNTHKGTCNNRTFVIDQCYSTSKARDNDEVDIYYLHTYQKFSAVDSVKRNSSIVMLIATMRYGGKKTDDHAA